MTPAERQIIQQVISLLSKLINDPPDDPPTLTARLSIIETAVISWFAGQPVRNTSRRAASLRPKKAFILLVRENNVATTRQIAEYLECDQSLVSYLYASACALRDTNIDFRTTIHQLAQSLQTTLDPQSHEPRPIRLDTRHFLDPDEGS